MNVGDLVKVKAPVGNMPLSKFTKASRIIKSCKNAVKLENGKIWNMNRVVVIRPFSNENLEDKKVSWDQNSLHRSIQDGQASCSNVVVPRRSTRASFRPARLADFVC